jgi:hypothetical protein
MASRRFPKPRTAERIRGRLSCQGRQWRAGCLYTRNLDYISASAQKLTSEEALRISRLISRVPERSNWKRIGTRPGAYASRSRFASSR